MQIAAPDATVFPLASAAGWAADVTGRNGTIELGFFKRTTLCRLKPLLSQAPTHSEWLCESGAEWSGTRLLLDLEASAKDAALPFTHAGWRAEMDCFVSCTTTCIELMFQLKSAAEGNARVPPFFADGLAY